MAKERNATRFLGGGLKERYRLEDLSFDGSDNIKMCLKEYENAEWISFSQDRKK